MGPGGQILHVCDGDTVLQAGAHCRVPWRCSGQSRSMAQICLQPKTQQSGWTEIMPLKLQGAQKRLLPPFNCDIHSAPTRLPKPCQEMNIALFLFHTPHHLMLYQDCWIKPKPRIITCNKICLAMQQRWQNLAGWPGARMTDLKPMFLSYRLNNVQGGKGAGGEGLYPKRIQCL